MNFGQRRGDFLLAHMQQASAERLKDLLPIVQACANDERKTEPVKIGAVESIELGGFIGGQAIKARASLFLGGFAGEQTRSRQSACQIGVRLDQGQSRFWSGSLQSPV